MPVVWVVKPTSHDHLSWVFLELRTLHDVYSSSHYLPRGELCVRRLVQKGLHAKALAFVATRGFEKATFHILHLSLNGFWNGIRSRSTQACRPCVIALGPLPWSPEAHASRCKTRLKWQAVTSRGPVVDALKVRAKHCPCLCTTRNTCMSLSCQHPHVTFGQLAGLFMLKSPAMKLATAFCSAPSLALIFPSPPCLNTTLWLQEYGTAGGVTKK